MKTPERWRPSHTVPSLSVFLRIMLSNRHSIYLKNITAHFASVSQTVQPWERWLTGTHTHRQIGPILYPRPLTREGTMVYRGKKNYSNSTFSCHTSFIYQEDYLSILVVLAPLIGNRTCPGNEQHIVACQAHPALVKIGLVLARLFHFNRLLVCIC